MIQSERMNHYDNFISSPAAQIIIAHCNEEHSVFVFPTGVSADTWADWTITHAQITGVHAVSMDRFIGWDDFKSASIQSCVPGKKSIPATLRSVFSKMLIEENRVSPFLKQLIPEQYAAQAAGYSEWITSLLPSLAGWKQKFDNSGIPGDDEDKDLALVYQKYLTFLDTHQLFDPAWEKPPFSPDENTYYIFYPEVLMDFSEYKELLTDPSASTHIHLVMIPSQVPHQSLPVKYYTNSRAEIRQLCLDLTRLHNENHVNWDDIAVSVNDIETYAPYVMRDFSLYHIPFVLRHGMSLNKSGAGSIFEQIQTCNAENFSFSALSSLLKNNDIPWKTGQTNAEIGENLNDALITFGMEHNCLCSYEDDGHMIDSWEQALEASPEDKTLLYHYRNLKAAIRSFSDAETFHEIRKHYFSFKANFLDSEGFTESNDLIIARCVSELSNLEDIEKTFPDCRCPHPFSFFIETLSSKIYLAQSDTTGIQIFPYKLVSTAPFACHVIIDASEASSTIVFKYLKFLREDKRKKLGIEDNRISQAFIQLYALNSYHSVQFSAAEKTFSGYTLPYSGLTVVNNAESTNMIHVDCDAYINELQFIDAAGSPPHQLTEMQKKGLLTWNSFALRTTHKNSTTQSNVIDQSLQKSVYTDGRIRISETALSLFFTCPRRWLLQKGLKVTEHPDEANLLDSTVLGNLHHAVLCTFLTSIKSTSLPLAGNTENLAPSYKNLLIACIEKELNSYKVSPLAHQVIQALKKNITDTLERALYAFCGWFSGCTVFATEQTYTMKPSDTEYMLHGRIDCLLSTEDGSLILIDFKSGSGPAKKTWYATENNKEFNFQMPMYLTLLEGQEHPLHPCCAVFFSLKDAKPLVVTGSIISPDGKTVSGQDFSTTLNSFSNIVTCCAEKIKQRDFSLPPAVTYETCSLCTYRTICRQTFTISGE